MPAMESVLQGDPEAGEALVALMSERDGLREFGARVLALAANSLMSAEADAMCGASLGERSDARVNSRNGCRPRSLKASVGDLELEIPKLRHGTCCPEPILERWGRVDASLAALVVEAHANGASTRDMSLLAQSLGASAMSSSEASRLAVSLDAQVAELRSRDLGDRRRCCLWVGATYARCRVEGRSVSQAAVTAIALDEDGRKRLVGPDCVDAEPCDDGLAFLAPVKAGASRAWCRAPPTTTEGSCAPCPRPSRASPGRGARPTCSAASPGRRGGGRVRRWRASWRRPPSPRPTPSSPERSARSPARRWGRRGRMPPRS